MKGGVDAIGGTAASASLANWVPYGTSNARVHGGSTRSAGLTDKA